MKGSEIIIDFQKLSSMKRNRHGTVKQDPDPKKQTNDPHKIKQRKEDWNMDKGQVWACQCKRQTGILEYKDMECQMKKE